MDNEIRLRSEALERTMLASGAAKSEHTAGRLIPEEKCLIRTDYRRDCDRIIHSSSFRRLKHKTQVFLSPEGDYYRTRLTHTLEVTQIARTIARALRLNEDLTEAIGLGHDLGHTPFGHAGERALNELCTDGFRHFEQSVRVVNRIEKQGRGLNLTAEVIDGIMHHTRGDQPDTLEGRVVRISDRIAYMNHDIDDAVRAGIFADNDIPDSVKSVLGSTKTNRINTLVMSVVENSIVDRDKMSDNRISMDDKVSEAFLALHELLFSTIYVHPTAKSEEQKVTEFIRSLYEYFVHNPEKLPEEFIAIADVEGTQRAATDFIAGMTDRYAVNVYNNLFIPQGFQK